MTPSRRNGRTVQSRPNPLLRARPTSDARSVGAAWGIPDSNQRTERAARAECVRFKAAPTHSCRHGTASGGPAAGAEEAGLAVTGQRINTGVVNGDVYVMAADHHIRVSDRVKALIDERRREGESYNDALERILGGERDLTDGMGFWSGTDADREAREVHERGKRKTVDRTDG